MPRPSQYIEVAVNRSFIEDDGELDVSYLEELRSAKNEILRTPLKHSFDLEPSDTLTKLENLKKDIIRSPSSTCDAVKLLNVGSRDTSFAMYEPRSRAPSVPAKPDAYQFVQTKIIKELSTRTDEELKDHFSTAMSDLDSLLKNLK